MTFMKKQFPTLEMDQIRQKINEIDCEYADKKMEAEFIGSTHNIIKSLNNVTKCSNDLVNALEEMIVGTDNVLNLKIDFVIADDLKNSMPKDQLQETEMKGQQILQYENWFDWKSWVSILKFLEIQAHLKSLWIKDKAGKGGRFTLADRLYGSPEDWLAAACLKFAEENNNFSKPVVLKIVQAIQEAYRGEKGKPAAGRKAVRKLAQTSDKDGTV
jgi:hypothetical protein